MANSERDLKNGKTESPVMDHEEFLAWCKSRLTGTISYFRGKNSMFKS